MLSKEDLAAKLNVAVRTIENWQQKHYLPTIKVEHLVMFYWPTVVLHLHAHFSISPRGVVKPSLRTANFPLPDPSGINPKPFKPAGTVCPPNQGNKQNKMKGTAV